MRSAALTILRLLQQTQGRTHDLAHIVVASALDAFMGEAFQLGNRTQGLLASVIIEMASGVQELKPAAAGIESLHVIRMAALTIRNRSLALSNGNDNRARPYALVRVIHMVDDEALWPHRSEADGTRPCLPQTQLTCHEPVLADIPLETREGVGEGRGWRDRYPEFVGMAVQNIADFFQNGNTAFDEKSFAAIASR